MDNRDRNDNMCSTVVAGVVAGEEKKLIDFRTAYRKSDGNLVKISGTASPLRLHSPVLHLQHSWLLMVTLMATLMATTLFPADFGICENLPQV